MIYIHTLINLNLVTNTVGVPQGSILGRLLFSLYINDLHDVCAWTINWQMYADDATIHLHAKSKKQAAEELSAAMVNITNWLEKSCLHLNISKTVFMFYFFFKVCYSSR